MFSKFFIAISQLSVIRKWCGFHCWVSNDHCHCVRPISEFRVALWDFEVATCFSSVKSQRFFRIFWNLRGWCKNIQPTKLLKEFCKNLLKQHQIAFLLVFWGGFFQENGFAGFSNNKKKTENLIIVKFIKF
jgi:hypothetical protein